MVTSSDVRADINGIPVSFNRLKDAARIAVKENLTVPFELRYPPELGAVALVVDHAFPSLKREQPGHAWWEWKCPETAGYFEVEFRFPHESLRTAIEVTPSKMSGDRYRRMMHEIQEVSSSLVFDFLGHGRSPTADGRQGPQDLVGEFGRLQQATVQFLSQFMRVAGAPLTDLRQTTALRRVGALRKVRSSEWTAVLRALGQQHATRHERLVRQSVVVQSPDTPENRYCTALAQNLSSRWERFRMQVHTELTSRKRLRRLMRGDMSLSTQEQQRALEIRGIQQHARDLQRTLRQLRETPPLAGLRPSPLRPSLRMIRSPAYREMHLLVQRMHLTEVVVPLIDVASARSLREIPAVYEIWTFLKLAEVLRQLGALVDPSTLLVEALGRSKQFKMELPPHTVLTFRWEQGEGQLIWQPALRPAAEAAGDYAYSSAQPQTPDFLLEVHRSGQDAVGYIMDAKYKKEGDACPSREFTTAMKYRDNVVPRAGARLGECCLLFPGESPDTVQGNRAIPVTPGNAGHLEGFLAAVMDGSSV